MSNSDDDFESPYFDWESNRLFDSATRELIDRIAHDPRFTIGHEGQAVADEWGAHLSEDRRRKIWNAAWEVFNSTIAKDLSRQASALVRDALADPGFDALPSWDGEDPGDDYFAQRVAELDPRLRNEVEYQLAASSDYQERQELARHEVEHLASELLRSIPRDVRDQLVLATRNARREELLSNWIGDVPSRRRAWIAYYAQRSVRETDERSVLDRYGAAAKILIGRGWSKKATAQTLAIASSRLEKLLERTTGQDLADDDPLCTLAPELRGAGPEWRTARSGPTDARPKAFSRMTVDERVALAAATEDESMQMRLAQVGSRRISEELIDRFVRSGDVSEDVLRALLDRYPEPWMRPELLAAHKARALPTALALDMAKEDPRAILYCDDATAEAAAIMDPLKLAHILAVRNLDIEGLAGILSSGQSSEQLKALAALLSERPLDPDLRDASRFIDALLGAANATQDEELSAELLLIACQNDAALGSLIQTNATTGSPGVSPQAIVTAALGPYHLSGSGRAGVLAGAQRLWAGTDLTIEHALARAVVAERGDETAVIETGSDIYVASGNAIRCFNKSGSTTYTYVHLHLTAATEHHFADGVLRMPTSLPAVPYRRELAINPMAPDGPEQEAIVWPIPLAPAIYSLGVSLGGSAGYFAFSDGRAAIVEDLGSGAPSTAAVSISFTASQVSPAEMTVREAVCAARELQVREGDTYGVGIEFTAPGDTEASFLQWTLSGDAGSPFQIELLEASSPGMALTLAAILEENQYSRSAELDGIWTADTSMLHLATETDLIDFLESQVRLLGAADGMPFLIYP